MVYFGQLITNRYMKNMIFRFQLPRNWRMSLDAVVTILKMVLVKDDENGNLDVASSKAYEIAKAVGISE